MGSSKNKKWGRAAIAGLVAAATLFGSAGTAFAGIGSGGGGIGPNGDILYLHDNVSGASGDHDQGWGDASIEFALNYLKSNGVDFGDSDAYDGHRKVYEACR